MTKYGLTRTTVTDSEEHCDEGGVPTKRVSLYGYEGTTKNIIYIGDEGELTTKDYAHHKIHQGNSYTSFQSVRVGAGASYTVILSTDGVEMHSLWNVIGTGEVEVLVYEDVTTVSDGTSVPVLNRDRNSLNVSGVSFYHTPSGLDTTNCPILRHRRVGIGKDASGEDRALNEYIAKINTKYAIVITNHSTKEESINWFNNFYQE